MSHFYVVCHFGLENGRVMLGHFQGGKLQVSEVRRFENVPATEQGSLQWDIPRLYHEMLSGLCAVGNYEEPVDSVSCISWAGDYLLFDSDGALITPVFHPNDPKQAALRQKSSVEDLAPTIFEETGTIPMGYNLFLHLGSEPSKRLRRARQALPVADGFNFFLSGQPRVELSMASATQLYSPEVRGWSERLLKELHVPPQLLAPIVRDGTVLGPLLPHICAETHLEGTQVLASASQEVAALMAGLPLREGENWGFLNAGERTLAGMQIGQPIINDATLQMKYTNQAGTNGSVCFYKFANGLRILDECRRTWEETDRSLDAELLTHLAGSAAPFESLIDPGDARFLTPGDMPQKIQSYCKETGQSAPRKPGPVYRCVLESLALYYKKLIYELELLSGIQIERVYFLTTQTHPLLSHFTANALQLPLVLVPPDCAAIGSMLVQAVALRHFGSLEQAQEIVRNSIKVETIVPQAKIWDEAYDRFVSLNPAALAEA